MLRTTMFSLVMALAVSACDAKKDGAAEGKAKAAEGKAKAGEAKAAEGEAKAGEAKAAEGEAKADTKAAAGDGADAPADGALAVAEYPKGIIGKWKKVKGQVAMPGVEPIDTMPPNVEMFLTYEEGGRALNSGTAEGKEYETVGTYKVVGNQLESGDGEGGLTISKLTANELTLELTTGEATTRDVYERVR